MEYTKSISRSDDERRHDLYSNDEREIRLDVTLGGDRNSFAHIAWNIQRVGCKWLLAANRGR